MAKFLDLSGQRFGLLQALERDGELVPPRFRVRCDCGTEKSVRADHLRLGKTISCGCEHKRRSSARASNMHVANVTHAASGTRAYTVWYGMRQRCFNRRANSYDQYGARGITICERWAEFANFLADMGQPSPGLTIERVDNDGPYSPENCVWATRAVQQNNRSVNRFHTMNGRTLTVSQWARESGVHRNTLDLRLSNGLSIEEATLPARRTNMDQVLGAAFASSIARKVRTHCKRGHEWTLENTGHQGKNGSARKCRACARETARAAAQKRRLDASA